jgi:ABC-2 type transport system permease protein
MFGWPDWLNRLSVFWAIGHPYLDWPTAGGLATLLILAVPGALIAAAIAERTPKTA